MNDGRLFGVKRSGHASFTGEVLGCLTFETLGKQLTGGGGTSDATLCFNASMFKLESCTRVS